jgi:hypothetical protein
MQSKRVYLENTNSLVQKPLKANQADKYNPNQENINTLNSNIQTSAKTFESKPLKVIVESRELENSSAKLLPRPKNVFLNLKGNLDPETFTSAERKDTYELYLRRSSLTLGAENEKHNRKDIIGSPCVVPFFGYSRGKKVTFDHDTGECCELDEESDNHSGTSNTSDESRFNCSFTTALNISKFQEEITNDTASLKNPRKFKLKRNEDDDPISATKITHKYLPINLKDDEQYKSKLFKYLRKPMFSETRTDTHKIKPRKFSELYGIIDIF